MIVWVNRVDFRLVLKLDCSNLIWLNIEKDFNIFNCLFLMIWLILIWMLVVDNFILVKCNFWKMILELIIEIRGILFVIIWWLFFLIWIFNFFICFNWDFS